MGTPQFACPGLEALLEAGHEVPLVLCQPDRKKGRGHKLQAPPVKELALSRQLEVYQPESLKSPEVLERLAAHKADFFVVVAYGKILPKALLDLPQKACINSATIRLHSRRLPYAEALSDSPTNKATNSGRIMPMDWLCIEMPRKKILTVSGAAPIQFSLWLGHQETGVCTMKMDVGMDTGDLLQTWTTPIDPFEDAGKLGQRLSTLGAALLTQTLEDFDQLTPQAQDHSAATYTRMITKEDRVLDWALPAPELHNRFRALSPEPGVLTKALGKSLRLLGLQPAEGQGQPGEVLSITPQGILVAAGTGALLLTQVMPESKGAMTAYGFAQGHQLQVGSQLGQT